MRTTNSLITTEQESRRVGVRCRIDVLTDIAVVYVGKAEKLLLHLTELALYLDQEKGHS